jgi:hypothetical protein
MLRKIFSRRKHRIIRLAANILAAIVLLSVFKSAISLAMAPRFTFEKTKTISGKSVTGIKTYKPFLGESWDSQIYINSEGFHDRLYDKTRSPESLRIAAVGGSFIFGLEIDLERTMAKLLETKLNERLPCDVEVLNLGMFGLPLHQYADWIDVKVKPYHVDYIIFQVTPFEVWNNEILRPTSRNKAVDYYYTRFSFLQNHYRDDRWTAEESRELYSDYLAGSGSYIRKSYGEIKDACDRIGAKCIGLLWPVKLKQNTTLFRTILEMNEALLDQAGLNSISLWSSYAGYKSKDLVLSLFDPHPNELANSLVAEYTAGALLNDGHLNVEKCVLNANGENNRGRADPDSK